MGWFSKNKKPPRRPRMEMVQDYLPQAKPFTKALILRASQYSDESYDELKKMAGKVNYEDNDKTFEDFVASSALTISNEITSQAAKSIGIETNYIPGFDIPKEAPYIVGFSVCILHLINEFLLGDEVTINLKFATIDTAKLHFMLHDNQEAAEQALKGIKIFGSSPT